MSAASELFLVVTTHINALLMHLRCPITKGLQEGSFAWRDSTGIWVFRALISTKRNTEEAV